MPSVIHVVSASDGGGAERLVRELTERLPDHGVQASAIYYRNSRGVELSERKSSLGLRSVRGPVAWKSVRDALRERGVREEGRIVHAHLTWPLYHLALLRREIGGPMVFTEHNTHNRRRELPWFRFVERWVYRRYDRLVAISEGTREALANWLADQDLAARMVTIQNGSRMLPMAERRPRPARSVRLVSVGSLSPQKGFDVALRAIGKLGDRVDRYTIVGEGPERGRLESLLGELGLQEKVRMPGYCEDVASYLHEADLGLIPSRWEGFGLVAVEALSTGLPLVASDVPGLRGVVGDCDAVVLSPPEDSADLENRIRYAIDHLVGRDDLARAARMRAEQFTIDAMVARYAELYKELAAESMRGEGRNS